MILMMSAAHPTVVRWQAEAGPILARHLGRLLTPRDRSRAEETLEVMPVAADNRAFAGFDETEYVRMLDGLVGLAVDFVVVPDVVADAAATDVLWERWAPEVLGRGLVPAYVAQDGMADIPDDAGALFVGGSTDFKVGPDGSRAVRQAHARNLLVHVGRVNTPGRVAYAKEIGATSFDGTKWAKWSKTYLLDGLRFASAPAASRLFTDA